MTCLVLHNVESHTTTQIVVTACFIPNYYYHLIINTCCIRLISISYYLYVKVLYEIQLL